MSKWYWMNPKSSVIFHPMVLYPSIGILSIHLYLFIGAMWVLLIISGAHNYSIMPKSHRYKITYVSPRVSNYRFSGPRNLLNISLGLFQKVAYTEVSKHSLAGPQYPVQDIPQTPAQFSKRGYKEKKVLDPQHPVHPMCYFINMLFTSSPRNG